MKNIYITKSVIHGRGLFTTEDLKEGDIIGVSHVTYGGIWYQVVLSLIHISEPTRPY